MKDLIPVGTPVTVKSVYPEHVGRNDLVVLAHRPTGYGIGPASNDPERYHSALRGWLFYSNDEVTPKTQESKVTRQFKKGDKVEFVTGYRDGEIKVGDTATFGRYYSDDQLVNVTMTSGKLTGEQVGIFPSRLKLIEEPKPFTFKDIQVGDTIRRTLTMKSGAKEIREGTVSKLASWYADSDGYIVAYDTDTARATDVTLELLNRPEPEPEPTLLENTKEGDRLVLAKTSGYTKVYTKGKDGQWEALIVKPDGGSYIGGQWTSGEVEELAADAGTKNHTLITK